NCRAQIHPGLIKSFVTYFHNDARKKCRVISRAAHEEPVLRGRYGYNLNHFESKSHHVMILPVLYLLIDRSSIHWMRFTYVCNIADMAHDFPPVTQDTWYQRLAVLYV